MEGGGGNKKGKKGGNSKVREREREREEEMLNGIALQPLEDPCRSKWIYPKELW